jgi:hypothetical protein
MGRRLPAAAYRQMKLEKDTPNRGAQRFYLTLPFNAPYADPQVYEDEDVLASWRGSRVRTT